MMDFVDSWFLFINHSRADLCCVELVYLSVTGQKVIILVKGIFVKEKNSSTLKDEISGIRTSLTVYLVRDHIQIIFFPLVCFEIKSLRIHQGLFFKHELLILPMTGPK